jgi:hypothetical protein
MAGLAAILPRWFLCQSKKRKSRRLKPPAFSLIGLVLVGQMVVNQAWEELGNIRNQPFMASPHKDRWGGFWPFKLAGYGFSVYP